MQCLVMLFCPYFYFSQSDLVIRASSNISLSTKQSTNHHPTHGIIGTFILSLTSHHLYNMELLDHLEIKVKCGWAESYASSKMMYKPYIYLQKYTAKFPNLKQNELARKNFKQTNTVTLIITDFNCY